MVNAVQFTFVTGVTRFAKVSIFSEWNNLNDLSQDSEYADFLGYTEQELIASLGAYVEIFCVTKGIDFEDGLTEQELIPITQNVSSLADELSMRFIWYTPTQYCSFNPIEQGLGPKRCSAAKTSIGVEPNGDVIPCQSYFESVGNILENDWETIWNSKLFDDIRNLKFIEPRCVKCEMLDICGGGCPLFVKQKYMKITHISHL